MDQVYVVQCACGWRATIEPNGCDRPRAFAGELARAHAKNSPRCNVPPVVPTPRRALELA